MRDPFAHEANEARDNCLARGPQVANIASRMMWLRIATGFLALALIVAILIAWHR